MGETASASSYIDKVTRCECGALVERIQPHSGSQGVAMWRHIVPSDHVAVPVESKPVHEIRTRITAGGNVEVWCTCGKYRGEAPSERAAQRGWTNHKEAAQ